jgi:hypothetical protein
MPLPLSLAAFVLGSLALAAVTLVALRTLLEILLREPFSTTRGAVVVTGVVLVLVDS